MKRMMFWVLALAALSGCEQDPYTYAEIETEFGLIRVKLFNSTPQHRDNFIKLAKEGYYDGLLFHRVMDNFMIQGGDPDSRNAVAGQQLGQGGPGYTIPAEFGERHFRGALAAARKGDAVNPQKASSGSQFYIVEGQSWTPEQLDQLAAQKEIQYTPEDRERYLRDGGTPFLDNDYTVFGEVLSGMEVVDRITQLGTDRAARPLQDVRMQVRIVD